MRAVSTLSYLLAACSAVTPAATSQSAAATAPTASSAPKSSAAAPKGTPTPPKPGKSPAAQKPAAAPTKAPPSKPTQAEPEGPRSCPSGMVLVEGDYCSKVEHDCKRSWFDKSNKKTVCEEFEPVSRCVGTKSKRRFCIDKYTWPNEKGARPEVMNRFHQAQVKCAAVGKRLCTESEWTLSCEGPRMLPFPYGYVRDTKKCHGDLDWDSPDMKKVAARDPEELARLWKGVRNGSQPACVSEYGVPDLPGNVDEVVASETSDGTWRAKYDSVHTGGPWYRGVRNQCRPKIYTHDEGFYYYFLGFRCCAEPDGKPTDPRTPRQIREGWKIERVERSAGFTVEQMKEKLELKKNGECRCAEKDILCKTMCGTLLAPSAKDYR
ncbi:MAG TPA: SUMF1/EgtB/PvdO family nonheme iron enzyme [Polyangiaceae bacterium]